jgi:hypothetical protein
MQTQQLSGRDTHPMVIEGKRNRERVEDFFRRHLCATQRECASALNLSLMAVNRHVRDIRDEWRKGRG